MQKSSSQKHVQPVWRLVDPLNKDSLIIVNYKEVSEGEKKDHVKKRQGSVGSLVGFQSVKTIPSVSKEPKHFLDTSSLGCSLIVKSPRNSSKTDEKSGFGTAISRFPPIKTSGLSPESYSISHSRMKSSIDLNSKGYLGAFLSKMDRFSYSPYPNKGPGPGQYNASMAQVSPAHFAHHVIDKNHNTNMHPRLQKSPKVRPLPFKIDVPGPGSYQINERLVKKASPNYGSVFKSMSEKSLHALL